MPTEMTTPLQAAPGIASHAWELLRPYFRWLYYRIRPSTRPPYFTECWQAPRAQGNPLAGAAPPRPAVVFLPMTDWHTRIQRSQHLARAFAARGHTCLYVNPHLGCEYHQPALFEPESRIHTLEPGVHEFHAHLPAEHVFHRRLLRPSESVRIARELSSLLADSRVPVILVVSFPIWLDVAVTLRRLHGCPIVYDCHDFLAGFRNVDRSIVEREDALLAQSDLIAFSARYLMDRTLGSHPQARERSVLIRNAVDSAAFLGAARRASPGPVVGYAGALDHWFDVDAVASAAAAHPHCRFPLIGRIEDERVQRLQRFPNVEFLGELPHSALPAHYASWHAGLIPFLNNQLTRAADPIKLYEYFSCGLPVVSTRLPEVERFHDLVYLADSPPDFASAVGAALLESNPARNQARREIARQESWSSRCTGFIEAIERVVQIQERVVPGTPSGG
jgi:glycosyltransferase involved in cell wall biosynthesis